MPRVFPIEPELSQNIKSWSQFLKPWNGEFFRRGQGLTGVLSEKKEVIRTSNCTIIWWFKEVPAPNLVRDHSVSASPSFSLHRIAYTIRLARTPMYSTKCYLLQCHGEVQRSTHHSAPMKQKPFMHVLYYKALSRSLHRYPDNS